MPTPADALDESPDAAPAVLAMRGVCRRFDSPRGANEVLDDVNLEVRRGEFVALIGFSGSGKTTLISLLAGLLPPSSGAVLFEGQPITGPGRERGVVFQNYSLLPWLSAAENVRLAVDQVYAQQPAAWRAQHVAENIAKVGLAHAADRRPAQLSGGMRQRVAVARALAMDPDVLLLDEPLSALDALTRASLQDELGRLHAEDKKTVVLNTNDVDEAILLADRIIPLTCGPRATLGPAWTVSLPRPRDRKALNHMADFKRLRSEITDWLQTTGRRRAPGEGSTRRVGSAKQEPPEHPPRPSGAGQPPVPKGSLPPTARTESASAGVRPTGAGLAAAGSSSLAGKSGGAAAPAMAVNGAAVRNSRRAS